MDLADIVTLNAGAAARRRRRLLTLCAAAVVAIIAVALFPMGGYMAVFFPLFLPTLTLQIGDGTAIGFAAASGSVAAVLVGTYLLFMLAAPRKSVVLYLRRFRLPDVAQAMGTAIESGLGRHSRVLTLDDANFVPLEVPRLERWLSRYAPPVPLLGGVLAFMAALWIASVMFERYGFSLNGFGMLSGLIWGGLLVSVVPFVGPMLQYWLLFLIPAALIHRYRVKKRSRLTIASTDDLSACLEYCRVLSGKLRAPAFLAPQATVVKVIDALWQDTVMRLAQTAEAIFIDISAPSAHVLWEVESTTRDCRTKVVYVGHKALVEQWTASSLLPTASDAGLQIRTILDGQTVLVYEPSSRPSRRRFRRSLRNAVDNLDVAPAPRRSRPVNWNGIFVGGRSVLPPMWKSVLLYVGLGIVCLLVNQTLWAVIWKSIV